MVEQFWQEPTDVDNRITCLILERKYMQTPRAATEMDKRPHKIFLVNYPPALCTSEG